MTWTPTITYNAQPATRGLNQQVIIIDADWNGVFGECGDPGGGKSGIWTFQWVPDASFDGELTVVARIAGPAGEKDGVPQLPVPYFARFLNGEIVGTSGVLPGIYSLDPITGTSLFELEGGALAGGILFAVRAGFGKLYVSGVET